MERSCKFKFYVVFPTAVNRITRQNWFNPLLLNYVAFIVGSSYVNGVSLNLVTTLLPYHKVILC